MAHGKIRLLVMAVMLLGAATPDYQKAAQSLDGIISEEYAYMDKLPDSKLPQSKTLDIERNRAVDRNSLLRYAEDRLASLADHHANTGSALPNSWVIVPSYADLWIVEHDGIYTIDAVRADSPAARAGIKRGDRLAEVGGIDTATAVATFWRDLGLDVTPRRAAYAARVLAAGRRDRNRRLGIQSPGAVIRTVALASLYKDQRSQPPLSLSSSKGRSVIRINNSLGDDATIADFDRHLARIPPGDDLVLDLRDTPSGGNTIVARAIMGWFVDRAQAYQIHNSPEEERSTGIGHQWVEEVLPRAGKHRDRVPTILVGRWTGSMGEGLAVGFAALGASVEGDRMAGLNGAVEDIDVGDTGLTIKLPTERIMTVTGLPREEFQPDPIR